MLRKLWDDYVARASKLVQTPLADEPLQDPIDESIRWQLKPPNRFAPHAPENGSLGALHLPELGSGEPTAPLVFVTLNPSYSGLEVFPTVDSLRQHGPTVIANWFEKRFAPKCEDSPLRHGRGPVRRRGASRNPPTCWKRVDTNPSSPIRGRSQRTWDDLERATLLFFESLTEEQQRAPLGRAARILDIVPWKFAKWGKGLKPAQKQAFLDAGAPWLVRALKANCPDVIVACGADVCQKMRNMGLPYVAEDAQRGWITIETSQGARKVRWFGICHPGAWPVRNPADPDGPRIAAFNRDTTTILPSVQEALREAAQQPRG